VEYRKDGSSGKERDRAVAKIIKAAMLDPARAHGERRLAAFLNLDLAFSSTQKTKALPGGEMAQRIQR